MQRSTLLTYYKKWLTFFTYLKKACAGKVLKISSDLILQFLLELGPDLVQALHPVDILDMEQ